MTQAHAVPAGGGVHRTLVMGVLNVTADSFSDGGRYLDADAAIAHGLELIEQGADLIDVGGESTRPGAVRVDPGLEAERVVPVIGELAARGVTVSVDTMRAPVAAAATPVIVTPRRSWRPSATSPRGARCRPGATGASGTERAEVARCFGAAVVRRGTDRTL